MIYTHMQRIGLISVILAAPALAQSPAGSAQAPKQPAPPAKAADTSRYAEINGLIQAHRAEQVKMVKLWRQIKAGQNDDKTRADYKEAQIRTQKASGKVVAFINQEHWSPADRAAMTKMWTDVSEKPID